MISSRMNHLRRFHIEPLYRLRFLGRDDAWWVDPLSAFRGLSLLCVAHREVPVYMPDVVRWLTL